MPPLIQRSNHPANALNLLGLQYHIKCPLSTSPLPAWPTSFLPAEDQHALRSTTLEMTAFFDYAAQTNTLCFYSHTVGQRWKFSPVHRKSSATPDVLTANVRNYFFSTMNTYSLTNTTCPPPVYVESNAVVHSYILLGLRAHKLFVTGLDGIKSIDKRFCEKITATEVEFGGANQLESISMHFMLRCPNLKRVTFAGAWPKLTSISNCFLAHCPELESVDFSGLTALKRVDERALFSSPKLASINFAPFGNTLEYIGPCFLGHVTQVPNLEEELAKLTAVKEIRTVGMYAPPALVDFAKDKRVAGDLE